MKLKYEYMGDGCGVNDPDSPYIPKGYAKKYGTPIDFFVKFIIKKQPSNILI
ncbi:hypothetical protein GOQ27_10295 [Clostridium sp. D2Q-11]|uniref:Uncharacterized protein n=1 Tax=Anaeromonas frigoriresistens TaxID=2683708 RepID=A0A942UXN6_9FIRM|nr:hypothetical protein [Anaeromonas frigoriresistens]MBS4538856.1 hypothetical protein [Anaeromonas frigoriresistens]